MVRVVYMARRGTAAVAFTHTTLHDCSSSLLLFLVFNAPCVGQLDDEIAGAIIFCVRHSRGEMYIGRECLCVCLHVCLLPHSHTAALIRM